MMVVTTTYEIETSAEFKEAVERLGGECSVAPCFDTSRAVVIVDTEEWEDPDEEDEPNLNPFPDDDHNIE